MCALFFVVRLRLWLFGCVVCVCCVSCGLVVCVVVLLVVVVVVVVVFVVVGQCLVLCVRVWCCWIEFCFGGI